MADEKPTLEEPTVDTPVEEQAGAEPTEVDALLETLQKAGVTTTQELQGKLTASKEAGQLANLLGDANKRIQDLEQAIKQPKVDEFDYNDTQPIDIEATINNVMDKREAKAREAQQKAMQVWGQIQNDPDYHLVKDTWEAKCKDPSFNMAISTGTKDVTKEYMETVREFYKGVAQKSHATIKQLKEGVAPATPHVEGNAELPGTPEPPASNDAIQKATEKVNKGGRLSEAEQMAALDDILRG